MILNLIEILNFIMILGRFLIAILPEGQEEENKRSWLT